MLHSLARFRKGITENGTSSRKDSRQTANDSASSSSLASSSMGLIGARLTKCDRMPKGSKPTAANKERRTKCKQKLECQKQSSIVEDTDVVAACVSGQPSCPPSSSSPIHSRASPNLSFEPNAFSTVLCSSTATSPGDSSSINSLRSSRVRLPDVSNLRKSGVHWVRNFRRSSLAVVMRAISIGTTAGHDQNASTSACPSAVIDPVRHDNDDAGTAAMPLRCRTLTTISTTSRISESVPASTEESSRHSTMAGCGNDGTSNRRKRSGWHGSAARRAMRKRISAARVAMRKISRISTHSGSTIATMASSSSAHSSPQTPVSVHGYPIWMPSISIAGGTERRHPLKKCQSDEQNNKKDDDDDDAAANGDETEQQHSVMNTKGKERQKQQQQQRAVAAPAGHGHNDGNDDGDEAAATAERENNNSSKKLLRKRSRTLVLKMPSSLGALQKSDRKPLGPSLSWDPQQCKHQKLRSIPPSSTDNGSNKSQRGRVHSDGSTERLSQTGSKLSIGNIVPKKENGGHYEKKMKGKRRKKSGILALGAAGTEKNGLELNCLHCTFQAEHYVSTLRSEIECAVKQLAIRLNSGEGPSGAGGASSPPATMARRKAPPATTTTTVRVEVQTERQQRQHQAEHQQQKIHRNIGTPDIVISSYNSEDTPAESAEDEGFWTNSSATVKGVEKPPQQQQKDEDSKMIGRQMPSNENAAKGHSTASAEANHFVFDAETNGDHSSTGVVWSPMDTLKPPGSPFSGGGGLSAGSNSSLYSSVSSASGSAIFVPGGGGHSSHGAMRTTHHFGSIADLNSPPRSNSVDLSLLRRDIERWSVTNLSIADSTTGGGLELLGELRNNNNNNRSTGVSTPGGDSTRTVRSRSYEPSSSPEYNILRRPSRIEHLSELFRKALAKSPVVKRAAAMQEQEEKRVSKHRTSRYWLEEQLSPFEHIWLPSSASASSTVDIECYLGEKDCQKMGDKRRCSGCHIVAHTACFPLLAKMNLGCKTTFRDCAPSAKSASPATRRQQRHNSKSDAAAGEQCHQQHNSELSSISNNTTINNNSSNKHHWVHRWRLEGRCSHCGKSFQQKMFREKEVIAITCSWCKRSYHNKRHCFSLARFDDRCDRGVLRELTLPPSWLLRLPAQRRRSANPASTSRTLSCVDIVQKRSKRRKYRTFVVKPPPASRSTSPQAQSMANTYSRWATAAQQLPLPIQPLLVFVNPKSGGNKGAKALNTLCWLLNPRQVFDINAMRGPKYGLDMFRKIHSAMRLLVCGGDGTVGWVLSTLDQLGWPAYPPIALLPLGTGNDLSRAMGWGGTFSSDEPLAEVLAAIQTETSITHLDRWRIYVCPLATTTTTASSSAVGGGLCNGSAEMASNNAEGINNSNSNNADGNCNNCDAKMEQQFHHHPTTATGILPNNWATDGLQPVPAPPAIAAESVVGSEAAAAVQSQLPLSVMNNYFSIGADAHVALQFHQSRSANPQMLNSRLKNRIAYGGLGTIDLFKRTWKDLSEYINVECDGVDITAKIREFKFHCLLFHNITFYAGGTVPWGAAEGVHDCGEVFSRPSPCDGKIEVLGFTTATLAALQMGAKGERIAQCSKVRIETSKPIPMQVDGEPCLLGPSLIHLSFHNKVPMLRREKFARPPGTVPCNNIVSMGQNRRKSSQNSSAASSVAGGATTTTGIMPTANGTVLTGHKSSTATNASPEGPSSVSAACADASSAPSGTMLLDVPVIVVGRHDYDTYRDSVERLKDTGFEFGILNVEAETELAQLRHQIQQMLCQHEILPYDPGSDWRFLDYMSNAEEGTFRVSRHQEQCRTVADVCMPQADEGRPGILILDDAFPSMSTRAAAIGRELVFTPAKMITAPTATTRNSLIRRRISETLRIVLANDAAETHL